MPRLIRGNPRWRFGLICMRQSREVVIGEESREPLGVTGVEARRGPPQFEKAL